MDVFKYFKGLFKKSEQSTPSNPYIREAITRPSSFIEEYEHWKNTRAIQQLMHWISEEFGTYLLNPDSQSEYIDFLNTPSSKGFVIHFSDIIHNTKDFLYLFEYLKEKTLSLGYRLYMSDRRIHTQNKWVEQLDRHYLKPRLKFEDSDKLILNQQFGNITILLTFRNNEIYNLKFSATNYRDRSFTKAVDYNELMKELIKIEE